MTNKASTMEATPPAGEQASASEKSRAAVAVAATAPVGKSPNTELQAKSHYGIEKINHDDGNGVCDGDDGEVSNSSSDSGGELSSNTESENEEEDEEVDGEDSHMDECFICDDGGELILCDGKGCNKAYHAECVDVDINTLPLTWYCPSCTSGSSKPKKTVLNDNSMMSRKGEGDAMSISPKTRSKEGNTTESKAPAEKKVVTLEKQKMANAEMSTEATISQDNPTSALEKPPPEAGLRERQGAASSVPTLSLSLFPSEKMAAEEETGPARSSAPTPKEASLTAPLPYFPPEPTTFRTVILPDDVAPGELFRVLFDEGKKAIGVICPEGVNPGDRMIIVEPGNSTPPVPPRTIAKMNAQHLLHGIDASESSMVANSFWKVLWPRLVAEGWLYSREIHYNFGAMKFFPPEVKAVGDAMQVMNVHYFETIMGITHFISKVPKYVKVLEEFQADISKRKGTGTNNQTENVIRKQRTTAANQKKKRKRTSVEKVGNLDAWKYLGEREHTQVGTQYQVRTLPRVRTNEVGDSEKYM